MHCTRLAFAIALAAVSLSGAATTLSVLPFDNLSSRERYAYLGRAMAEMLSADLAQVEGVAVVERGKMEEVSKEIALGMTGMVDESTAPQVGRMLGAQYLVTGTCVVTRRDATVAYKLIAVESGAVSTSGNAAGSAANVAELESRLFQSALAQFTKVLPGLKSRGTGPAKVDSVSADDLASYGEALELRERGDYTKAAALLKDLLGRRPSFRYARTELSALEVRIAEYDKIREAALAAQRKQPLTWTSFIQTTTSYMTSMQYTRLLSYCEALRPSPPEAPAGSIMGPLEMIDFYTITSLYMLKRWGDLPTVAEKFLKDYPVSAYYASVKTYLTQAVNEVQGLTAKRSRADKAAAELLTKLEQADVQTRDLLLFQLAAAYFGEGIYDAALGFYRRIHLPALEAQSIAPDLILLQIFMCYYNLQQKSDAQRVARTVETLYPESQNLSTMRSMLTMFPE